MVSLPLLFRTQLCFRELMKSWQRVSIFYFCESVPRMNLLTTKELPVGRLGRPEEIAETVMWMVKTGYVTNKIITVDGGWVAH